MEVTQRLCGSHASCVAATQGLLLLYNSTIGAVQQPQGLLLSYNSTIVAAEQARIRPENIESGTNEVGKPPFGLKLCVVRAVPLRMPPACLDCQKNHNSLKKTGCSAIFGPWAPSGHISALFPGVVHCPAGWREALITLVICTSARCVSRSRAAQ